MSTPNQPADFIGAFMDDYFAECDEHLHAVRHGLMALDAAIGADAAPRPIVEDLFRSFHSLKGISAMVELREAERLAHEMESALRAIRAGEIAVSAPLLDAFADGVHALERVIAARKNASPIPAVDDVIGRLGRASSATAAEPARSGERVPADAARAAVPGDARVWKVTFTPTADLVARGIKVDTIRARLAEAGDIRSVAPRVTAGGIAFDFHVLAAGGDVFAAWAGDGVTAEPVSETASDAAQEDAPRPAASGPDSASPGNFVRVDLARLDDLMRLVGDLVVTRARLDAALARVESFTPAPEWRMLQEHSEGLERHLRDLREGVMRVRLVPVGEIFRRMPFVVRDLARDTGKRIRLDLSGQSTEIDKFLIERMMDPVLHLVRNAVSHGLESPDERVAAGKRPEGTIRLAASTLGESVVLEVADDGRGVDAAGVARRARSLGVDVPDGALDPRLLLDILSAPGFSTRDAADRTSGRGVGMSVVRDTVQDLGGTLTLETTAGEGTTFRMVLPLTLAITDALIVHAGDRVFAVPQSAVREVAEVDPAAIRVIENNELVTHRGAALPVLRLTRLFGLTAAPRPRLHLIVIGAGSAATGLLVDRIAGQREIVVKTLNDPLVKIAGVSGATELGDGRLVLILEPAALTRRTRARGPAGPVRAAG